MELHFFKEFLMISHPTTVFLLLLFLLILAMIHHLEKKGTSFGKLVTIGTVSGALLGIFIQVLAGFPDAPTKVVFIKEATNGIPLSAAGSSTSSACLLSPWSLLPSSTSSFI